MVSITSLVTQLKADYPEFSFEPHDTFGWRPDSGTITYAEPGDATELLHELGHALLGHRDFSRDITLLEMERDAWHTAQRTLAPTYHVTITNDAIDDALDTYRDWLHARSLCPSCGATGLQSARTRYRCLACLGSWRVNDARQCSLRRYRDKPTKNPA